MSRWTDEQISQGREQSSWNEGYSYGRHEAKHEATIAATATLASSANAVRFADWLRGQAGQVRSQNSTAADWLASKIDGLATEAECLDCDSPDEFDDRDEALRKLYQGE